MAKMTQCIHCKHGKFMQWMKNPIICECTLSEERFVAEAVKLCPLFERSNNPNPEITHYSKYD
ncbi:MAG: hypothetical protein NC388_07015 [Clostridium sp.]|nr:hypothetical protein [Clostridium sp.]